MEPALSKSDADSGPGAGDGHARTTRVDAMEQKGAIALDADSWATALMHPQVKEALKDAVVAALREGFPPLLAEITESVADAATVANKNKIRDSSSSVTEMKEEETFGLRREDGKIHVQDRA